MFSSRPLPRGLCTYSDVLDPNEDSTHTEPVRAPVSVFDTFDLVVTSVVGTVVLPEDPTWVTPNNVGSTFCFSCNRFPEIVLGLWSECRTTSVSGYKCLGLGINKLFLGPFTLVKSFLLCWLSPVGVLLGLQSIVSEILSIIFKVLHFDVREFYILFYL